MLFKSLSRWARKNGFPAAARTSCSNTLVLDRLEDASRQKVPSGQFFPILLVNSEVNRPLFFQTQIPTVSKVFEDPDIVLKCSLAKSEIPPVRGGSQIPDRMNSSILDDMSPAVQFNPHYRVAVCLSVCARQESLTIRCPYKTGYIL